MMPPEQAEAVPLSGVGFAGLAGPELWSMALQGHSSGWIGQGWPGRDGFDHGTVGTKKGAEGPRITPQG